MEFRCETKFQAIDPGPTRPIYHSEKWRTDGKKALVERARILKVPKPPK